MDYICIYAKPPLPGRTKARLAESIGDEAAAALAKAMLLDLADVVAEVAEAVTLLWHPPDAEPDELLAVWPRPIECRPQQGRDLGERMYNTFRELLADAPGSRALVLGSDCVEHTPATIRQAFAALASRPQVFQPAFDGGYVTVGQAQLSEASFTGIDWGGDQVMAQTRQRLQDAGIAFAELEPVADVDVIDDLPRLARFAARTERRHTSQWLAAHEDLIAPRC